MSEWTYEKEIRIIQNTEWFDIKGGVKRVICESRMKPAKFNALNIICEKRQIPTTRMYIDNEGIDLIGERDPSFKFAKALENYKDNTQPGPPGNSG